MGLPWLPPAGWQTCSLCSSGVCQGVLSPADAPLLSSTTPSSSFFFFSFNFFYTYFHLCSVLMWPCSDPHELKAQPRFNAVAWCIFKLAMITMCVIIGWNTWFEHPHFYFWPITEISEAKLHWATLNGPKLVVNKATEDWKPWKIHRQPFHRLRNWLMYSFPVAKKVNWALKASFTASNSYKSSNSTAALAQAVVTTPSDSWLRPHCTVYCYWHGQKPWFMLQWNNDPKH